MADLLGGQKTGIFFDQRPNHAFAPDGSRKGRGCSTCSPMSAASALPRWPAALPRRWRSMPRPRPWRWPKQGARAGGVADRFTTRQGDAFDVLETLVADNARFDLVICDPPAFAPGEARAGGGPARLRTSRAACGPAGGAGRVSRALFLLACRRPGGLPQRLGARDRAGRAARADSCTRALPGPTTRCCRNWPRSGYLKALFFRLDG